MSRFLSLSLFAVVLLVAGCASENADGTSGADSADYLEDLVITDLVEGDGQMVEAGHRAVVHYTLWFRDANAEDGRGERVQSSKDSGRTFPFVVGRPGVIDGWNQGVPGMKVGGTRELQVPYRLAYGEDGRSGAIPPKQDMIFEIELVEIQ